MVSKRMMRKQELDNMIEEIQERERKAREEWEKQIEKEEIIRVTLVNRE